jgi:hypothetical protein
MERAGVNDVKKRRRIRKSSEPTLKGVEFFFSPAMGASPRKTSAMPMSSARNNVRERSSKLIAGWDFVRQHNVGLTSLKS